MKERNPLFDYLKGFAILLVVLGHSIQSHLGEASGDNPVFRLIYSFHMPLFMFISGYVSFENRDKSVSKLFQKVKSLVLPFIAWSIIALIVAYASGLSPGLTTWIINIFKRPDNGLWFLWILFLNHFLLFVARQINGEKEGWYLFLLLIAVNICWRVFNMDYLGIGLLRWHLLFFLTGYMMNKKKQFEKLYDIAGWISCFIFPLSVVAWNFHGNPAFYDSLPFSGSINNMIVLSYNYVVAISGTLAVYTIFKWGMTFGLFFKTYLSELGKLTLEIYCCHAYFLNLVSTTTLPFYLQVIISFIMGLSISLLIQYLVKKVPLVPLFLYGKESKKKTAVV